MIKIEIEWESSIDAKLTIQGRDMRVRMIPREGSTNLEGIEEPELTATFGGQVAQKLFGLIGDMMQAECIAQEETGDENCSVWTPLSEESWRNIEDRLF